MSDYTANGDLHQVKRVNKTEFVIYFALIFSLAVLPHVVGGCCKPCGTPNFPGWGRWRAR
jgi:hypothetical protein